MHRGGFLVLIYLKSCWEKPKCLLKVNVPFASLQLLYFFAYRSVMKMPFLLIINYNKRLIAPTESEIKMKIITVSGSGSDAASLTTSARKDGDSYVLNGSKVCILVNYGGKKKSSYNGQTTSNMNYFIF